MKLQFFFPFLFVLVIHHTLKAQRPSDSLIKLQVSTLFKIKLEDGRQIRVREFVAEKGDMSSFLLLDRNKFSPVYDSFKVDYIFSIQLKAEVKLITLSQIFDIYRVKAKYRNYPVYCDDYRCISKKLFQLCGLSRTNCV